MFVTIDQLRAINFMSTSEHSCSKMFLRHGFRQYLAKIGAVISHDNDRDDAFYIRADNPNELMKLLYPNSPWNYYICIKDKKDQATSAINYYLENHLTDGKMILFDSGYYAYAAFKDETDAMQFKLALP